jgi:hypothetical protein
MNQQEMQEKIAKVQDYVVNHIACRKRYIKFTKYSSKNNITNNGGCSMKLFAQSPRVNEHLLKF